MRPSGQLMIEQPTTRLGGSTNQSARPRCFACVLLALPSSAIIPSASVSSTGRLLARLDDQSVQRKHVSRLLAVRKGASLGEGSPEDGMTSRRPLVPVRDRRPTTGLSPGENLLDLGRVSDNLFADRVEGDVVVGRPADLDRRRRRIQQVLLRREEEEISGRYTGARHAWDETD